MDALTTHDLAHACRIFMDLAYEGGADTMPASKRPYFEMDVDGLLEDFLPPAKCAASVCQELPVRDGVKHGYEFRLGSANYPHLKLRVQRVALREREVWVYSVNTHDGFQQATKYFTSEEADAWRLKVEQNRTLKYEIEKALTLAGYVTPKELLQIDLPTPTAPA